MNRRIATPAFLRRDVAVDVQITAAVSALVKLGRDALAEPVTPVSFSDEPALQFDRTIAVAEELMEIVAVWHRAEIPFALQ